MNQIIYWAVLISGFIGFTSLDDGETPTDDDNTEEYTPFYHS